MDSSIAEIRATLDEFSIIVAVSECLAVCVRGENS